MNQTFELKRLSLAAIRLMRGLRALYDGLWLLPIIRRIPAPRRKWVGLGLIGLAHLSHDGLWVVPFVPLTLELKIGARFTRDPKHLYKFIVRQVAPEFV